MKWRCSARLSLRNKARSDLVWSGFRPELTKVRPNPTVQSTETFIPRDRNKSVQGSVVLWSKGRPHSPHLHFPPYHVERICQRLRNRPCSVAKQTIGIRSQHTELRSSEINSPARAPQVSFRTIVFFSGGVITPLRASYAAKLIPTYGATPTAVGIMPR